MPLANALAMTETLLGVQTNPPPAAYAAAVASADAAGRDLVIAEDGRVMVLAPFQGVPDVSCDSPAEARKLNEAIRVSGTISGEITPAFPTTVVSGFVDATSAVCWQYSPPSRAFVKIGGWET